MYLNISFYTTFSHTRSLLISTLTTVTFWLCLYCFWARMKFRGNFYNIFSKYWVSRNFAEPFSVVLVMSGRGRGPRTPPPGSCSRPWGWWGRQPPGPGCWHSSCGAGWSSCRTPDGPQYLYFLFYTHLKNPICTLLQLSEMKRSAPAPNIGPQLGWWDTANSFFLMSNLQKLGPEQDRDWCIVFTKHY